MSNIDGNVKTDGGDFVGRNRIESTNIYADQHTWRLDVQDRFYALHRTIAIQWGWIIGILIAACVISLVVFVITLFAIRQFDWTNLRIERHQEQIDRLEQRVIPPIPFTPMP